LTSHGPIWVQITSRSGFGLKKNPWKDRCIRFKINKRWSRLHEIHSDSNCSTHFQKVAVVQGCTTVTIAVQTSSRGTRQRRRDNFAFIRMMQGSTPRNNVGISVEKMVCGSSPTHPTPLILHHPTFSCSDMSNSLSQEWPLHHATSYSRRFRVCRWRSR
jgi:hypothetical protein